LFPQAALLILPLTWPGLSVNLGWMSQHGQSPTDEPALTSGLPSQVAPGGAPGGGTANPRSLLLRPWIPGLLLIAATLLAYGPVWQADFIWDDDAHVTRNPCVVGPSGLWGIWTSHAARICPLVQSSFWVQHAVWGLSPLPYHLVTLLMHAGAAVVLWRVLGRLKVPGAWLGAALWALHPVQVESVAWVTELKNTQSGLFYMLTGLFFVRARLAEQAQEAKRAWRDDWVALGCGLLAMASKSSTVILPVVLGLCAWWVGRGWRWRNVWRLAPYLVLSGLSSALALWTQRLEVAGEPESVRSWAERVITAGKVVWFYLGKLLWPEPLIFIYPKWEVNPGQVMAYLPLALVVAGLGILWWWRKGWSRGSFMAFACFVAALAPVLGLVNHYFLRYSFVGDHFQYLASIGPLALVGAGLWRLFGAWEMVRARAVVCGLLLGVLGALSWQRAGVFRNDQALWHDTLAKNPDCWMGHNNLGTVLQNRGELGKAVEHYEQALQLKPDSARTHNNLGNTLFAQGKSEEAISHYERAIQMFPDFAKAHNNLGNALAKLGKLDEAILHYERALQVNPDYGQAHINLGNALCAQEKLDEAIQHYRQALQVNPNDAIAHFNLGNALCDQGKWVEAFQHLQQALKLATAQANRGLVQTIRRRLQSLPSAVPQPQSR
jgi:protein O-mannosyl-transferase